MSTSVSVWCSRCAAFVDRWAYREGDTDVEQVRKRTATVATLSQSLGSTLLVANVHRYSPFESALAIYAWSQSTLLFASLRVRRQAGVAFFALMSASFLFYIMVADWISAAENNRRIWPVSIVLIDILLVARVPHSLTLAVVGTMCAHLLVLQAEETWRFGLFDVSVLAPYEDRLCQGDCDKPPCPRLVASSVLMSVTNLFLFLLDFYFTRGFAMQVRREKEKIAAAVEAAQRVAERLASFDLEAAEDVLESQEDMPPDLCESLRVILSHLRAYKPFLPQSVLLMTTIAPSDDSSASSLTPSHSTSTPKVFTPSGASAVCHLNKRRLSLLHLHASLPDVAEVQYTSVHRQILAFVLKHAATCKGVVDHFCGDAVSLSYNASSQCVRHPMMAVQTAAALCLEDSGALSSRVRGGVATGHARVGTMGVPELQRHCIVGVLDTVCQHIVQAAVLLERPLLCLHSTAVDVAFSWHTRVSLHRLVFDLGEPRSFTASQDTEDPFGGSGCVVYEVLGENVAPMDKSQVSAMDGSPRVQQPLAEWMYELEAQASSEWDAYNRAGLAFHRAGGNAEAALQELRAASTNEDHITMFSKAASESQILAFCPRLQSYLSHDRVT